MANTLDAKLTLTSPDFKEGHPIALKHTWKDKNKSPILQWTGAPKGTQSFALICDDPDAPKKTWVHWVVYNIPASYKELMPLPKTAALPMILSRVSMTLKK